MFLFHSSCGHFLQDRLVMSLQLCELFLQDLQPLLLVGDVHHGGCKLLRLQQLLKLGQLRLLLLIGNIQSLLDIQFVIFVLLFV